jgi:hypothetical protein
LHRHTTVTCAASEHEIAAPVEAMVALWQIAPIHSGRWFETSLAQLLAQ